MKIISRSKTAEKIKTRVTTNDNLLLFTLLGDQYALISDSVLQILQTLRITPVANSVRYFIGSTTFRGEVVPVIDLQSFFYGGKLAVPSKTLDEHKSYIALDHSGKTIIFQVETILGSVEMPEESEVTGLVNFANPEENPYYDKAFLHDEQIIVLLEHDQILERVIFELEQSQTQFIEENKAFLAPIELPEASKEYNIDLKQKFSAHAPTTSAMGMRKAISSTRKITRTATLVSVQDLDILIPNNSIIEIYNVPNITKVPNAPKAVVGAINFRGNVISALDLAEILVPTSTGMKKKEMNQKTAIDILILESAGQQFAIFIDEIREIIDMTEDDLRQTLASSPEVNSDYYFQGVMLDQSGHIILVLDVDYLLQVISNPVVLDQDSTQVILFDVPTHEVTSKTEVARQAALSAKALVLITLLGDKYALMSASVVQILQTLRITPVANSVRYFIGSTTFRGEVVPVIDLQSFFYGGQLNTATRTPDEHKSYIALDHSGRTIILQVETVLGSVEMPEESEVTGLVNFANPEENPYYDKAFNYNEHIIVLLEHGQILERVIYELEQSQTRFIEENKALLIPIELPKASEEYNIDLKQKFSAHAPTTSAMGMRKAISSTRKVTRTATLVSVQDLDILIPNNSIIEIYNVPNITKVPNAPKAVVGAINFRGSVISALSLAEILVPTSTDVKKDQSSLITDVDVLILESAGQQFAIFVDEIREIVEMTENDLRQTLASSIEAKSDYYFQGVMLDQSGYIILVLNVDYLLQVIINPEVLYQDSTQTILFDVPAQEVVSETEVARQVALSEKALLLITLLGDKYALMSASVVQILQTLRITPVANSVRYFVGSTTFRGEVVPVIDLQSFFYGGQLTVTSRTPDENKNYIALDHVGKIIIFQVETVLGSIEMPEESEVTGLVNFANPEENPYYKKAFIHDEQIVVLFEHGQILERVIYELEQSQTQFIQENQALLVPIELPEASEEYNIDLKQKLSAQAPTTSAMSMRKAISSTRKVTSTATLVSVKDLDILVPNNSIIEIYNVPIITKVPNAPKAVVGAIDFRGSVISALNLAEILVPTSTDIKKKEMNRETAIDVLILESADQQFAIFVDEIREIVEMTEDELRQTIASSPEANSDYYFQGVMLDKSGHIILVLNVDYLLQVITSPEILEQDSTQVILFDVPTQEVVSETEVARQVALGENDLVLITLFGDKYALMSAFVVQIIQTLRITPIANSVRYFVGSTTFRGEVVPVIDLQSFFYGGQLNIAAKTPDEQNIYIALSHAGKTIIFQVETVLGSIEMPEESEVTGLVNFANPEENPYYDKAFIFDEQIIVLLEHGQILERVIYELEQSQTQFIQENQALLVPIELPEASEEYNIDLQQKLSAQAPTTGVSTKKAVRTIQETKLAGTLVSVQNLDILVPNDHIVEIFSVPKITKVPNAPKAIVGSISFRGDVLSVLNLAGIMVPGSTNDINDQSSLTTDVDVLILESADQRIALFVDEIREMMEIDEAAFRPILASTSETNRDHYFEGLLLDHMEQIILVLNVDYLFQVVTNPDVLEEDSTQIVYFENPVEETTYQVTDSLQEGLIFEDEGHLFYLDSEYVIQVIEQNTFQFKKYSHDAIIGAAIHTNVVPLIDFSIILKGKRVKPNTSKKSVGILVSDPKSELEVVLLVDSVMNRVPIDEFETFQTKLGISTKALSPIVSGFFSYRDALGMIMSPGCLFEEIFSVLQDTLPLKDIKKEFSSTLLPEENEFLEAIRARRKELELLLFYHHEGIRLDYFVFKRREKLFSIDIVFVRRVFASLELQDIDPKYHPIIGIATEDNVKLPIIDLAALILDTEKQTELTKSNYFFSIEQQNQTFLVPVDGIEGVVMKFKEELIPCEDASIFLEGNKTCQHTFSHENVSSPIYIIENEFMIKMLTTKDLETQLKKLRKMNLLKKRIEK